MYKNFRCFPISVVYFIILFFSFNLLIRKNIQYNNIYFFSIETEGWLIITPNLLNQNVYRPNY